LTDLPWRGIICLHVEVTPIAKVKRRVDSRNDPLLAGFYTHRRAAQLLGMENSHRLKGWLDGWANGATPIIHRDFEGSRTVSFLDLIEARFVEHFRKQGVSLQTLRRAAERARCEWDVPHPFALSNVVYLTDRRKIFGQVAEEGGDRVTWDLATNQLEMWDAIERIFAHGVTFSPRSAIAELWHPLQRECPDVVINPRVAFGRPSIGEEGIPTAAVFRLWKVEGNRGRVASWFHVPESYVEQSIDFEIRMAA